MLSIIIPALNEEDGIRAIVDRVLATSPALSQAGVDQMEVIVVDDGSHDQTAAVVERYLAPSAAGSAVRLIRHRQNRGYGAALKTGLRLFLTICSVAIAYLRDFAAGVPSATAGSTSVVTIEMVSSLLR